MKTENCHQERLTVECRCKTRRAGGNLFSWDNLSLAATSEWNLFTLPLFIIDDVSHAQSYNNWHTFIYYPADPTDDPSSVATCLCLPQKPIY